MEKFFFMESVLRLISQGKFFNKAFAFALRVIAVAVAFAGLVAWIFSWKTIFGFSATGIIGGIVFQLFYVIAIYTVVHTLLLRSQNIDNLPEAEYTVIPIASITFKLMGEAYAGFVAVISVAGGIFTWLAGKEVKATFGLMTPMIPHFGDVSFLGGLVFCLGGILVAFSVLVLFYFLSESVIVMVDIARNTKMHR